MDSKPLHRIGFWDLVERSLSIEGYYLAHDGSGYQSILSMWNAAEAIIWYLSDFAGGTYKTIVQGMEELPKCLFQHIQRLSNGKDGGAEHAICLGWELSNITYDSNKFILDFRPGPIKEGAPKPQLETVRAETVVLALPQPALKNISIKGLHFVESEPDEATVRRFHTLLDSVVANPLFKLFLFYDRPWWKDGTSAFPKCMRIFTDLQLRQIYQFGEERQTGKANPGHSRSKSCLLLAYCDARYAEYWKNLDMCKNGEINFTNSYKNSVSAADWSEIWKILSRFGTGDDLVLRAREQLSRVTNNQDTSTLKPNTAFLMHWSDPPYYAGWHAWKMGIKPWVVSRMMVEPFLERRLFTCGEAFSSEQGWIEGALKSAERVLESMGLKEPDWVDAENYRAQKDLWL